MHAYIIVDLMTGGNGRGAMSCSRPRHSV